MSTEEQATSGLGLAAQKAAIHSEVERRGWTLVEVIEDAGYSGKDLKRPGIVEALRALRDHEAAILVVAKLDRLSRSMLDFASILDRATREHWAVVALDMQVDTTTPAGEMMVNVLVTFAQFERRLIGQRTKDALAQVKLHGSKSGKPIGRPPGSSKLPIEVVWRIDAEREAGRSLPVIAAGLNANGIATAQGGRQWYPSTVRAVLHRAGR